MNKKPEGMMPADKLPPLPEPFDNRLRCSVCNEPYAAPSASFIAGPVVCKCGGNRYSIKAHVPTQYTTEQALAYGAACRAAALEEAAQVCDSWIVAKAIRSL